MTYPCNRCNMDEGSPICLQDERCPRHERNAYGPAHLAPQPAHGLEFDERGVLVPVTKKDANDYCRVLTALGMEEEGDPVAAIEMLRARLDEAMFVLGMHEH